MQNSDRSLRTNLWLALVGLALVGCAPEGASERERVPADDDPGVHQQDAATPAMIVRHSVFDGETDGLSNARYIPFDRNAGTLSYDTASEILERADLGQLPGGAEGPAVTAYAAYNLPNATRTPIERIWVTSEGKSEQYVRTVDDANRGDWFLASIDDPTTAASAYPLAGRHTGLLAWSEGRARGVLLDGNDDPAGALPALSLEDIDELTPWEKDAGALRSYGDSTVHLAARPSQVMCSEDLGDCSFEAHGGSYACRLMADGVLTQTWWREETNLSTADTLVGFERLIPLVDGVPEFACATPVRTLPQSTLDPLGLADITAEGSYIAAYNPNVRTPARYVALGDSYSSGAGLYPYVVDRTPDTSDDRCQRGKAGWPEMVATAIGAEAGRDTFGDGYSNSACGGAKTSDVMEAGQWPGMDPQLIHVDQDTDMVTISIGGNDLAFGAILRGCVLGGTFPGTNDDCRTYPVDAPAGVQRRTFTEEIDTRLRILGGDTSVQDQVLVDPDDPSRRIWPIASILEAVIDEAGPSTQIRVVGIPRVMSGDAIAPTQSCLLGMTGDEAAWVDGIVDRLNAVSREAVFEAREHAANHSPDGGIIDIQFIDPAPVFEGHGACVPDVAQRWINLVDIDTAEADWKPWQWKVDGSLHPTAEGAFQVAKLVLESL